MARETENPDSTMSARSTDAHAFQHAGTSQADRVQAALDPDYVSIDERSVKDLLAFAREYAKELRYYGVEHQHVHAMGDWSGFLGPEIDLEEVVAYMQEPARFPPEKAKIYARPHFALFLTFLQLLGHAQDQLNTLTGRHLDFYYQQVLGLTKKAGIPDRAHILVELRPGTDQFLLPAGTRLNAGTDSLGQDLCYSTDQDIVVNRAQIARLSSVYVDEFNLYPAADATLVSVYPAAETETELRSWKTFGRGQPSGAQDGPPAATIGWAISSPILALSQGKRTITLTLEFQADQFDAEAIRASYSISAGSEDTLQAVGEGIGPFRIEMSTEKGWIEPDTIRVKVPDSVQTIEFELVFSETVDPLAPLGGEAQIDTAWPVLRLMLRPIWQAEEAQAESGGYITHYQRFKNLLLVKAGVMVDVSGLTPLQMQNDETRLAPNKPFQPFGSNPVVGSRFYLGHPELAGKRLDSLGFQVEWLGVPDNLAAHYANYGLEEIKFTAQISLIDRQQEINLLEQASLFADSKYADPEAADPKAADPKASDPHWIKIPDFPKAIEAKNPKYKYDRVTETVLGDDLLAWNRYLQWELNPPDFQHTAYPTIAAKKSIELAAAISKKSIELATVIAEKSSTGTENAGSNDDTGTEDDGIKAEDFLVNPPYTPQIKSLRLSYKASAEIIVESYQPGSQIDRLYHIHPFGYNEVQPETHSQAYPFLPQYHYEGELYIGIRDVQPPQNLSLLFQVAEASADPELEPVPVQWSYLSGNRWVGLDDGGILQDTTRGLINRGIISFSLRPVQTSTLLPPELYWIRAAIPKDSNSVCDTIAIHSQAVAATFTDHGNAPDHLSRPLPAGSLTDLAVPHPEVKGIRQPYPSFGGKMAEQEKGFYARISERLRHKNRALTGWDYEHMILDEFPQLYKAKCLPASPDELGRIEIVVIPDIRHNYLFDPFEPKVPTDLVADIETFLAAHAPAFASVRVKNACYEPVKARFSVRFLPGYSEGYYKQRLNEEIKRFLSPWAYEDGADIVIGARLYANDLINFIEERAYVDYVTHFQFVQPLEADDWVETSRPDGVLVAAREHEIRVISDGGGGIEQMMIGFDFVVA